MERDGKSKTLVRQPLSALYHASAAHFSQFLSAIDTGAEPAISAIHAREVLRIVFAGYKSASEGGALVELRPSLEPITWQGVDQPMAGAKVK